MDVFAATLGTLDASLFIFRKAKDHFKRLFAVLAVELITRHGDLRIVQEDMNLYSTVYARVAVVSRQEESTEEGVRKGRGQADLSASRRDAPRSGAREEVGPLRPG